MKDIFTDLYKKVVGFFQATEEKEKENAKDVACNRLKFVLMQDRTNLNPYLLERLRSEMIDVLSKYVEMDKEALELSFEQEGEQMALMLSIPVIRAKDEEEIQALLKEEEEKKAASEEAEESETESESDEDAEEETEEEIEEDAQGEETQTPDVESESTEEEVCSCGETEEEINSDEDTEDEEETSSKKSKKNRK